MIKMVLLASAAFVSATAASAVEFVINGDFEQTKLASSSEFGSRFPSQQLTGWATDGYNFVFKAGTADTIGATSEYNPLKLWGPGDGAANGLPASSPTGGNFVAADGAFGIGNIRQTITGLQIGKLATLTFYWAGAQQQGFDGATTEQWTASLGSEEYSTVIVNNVTHGFTGWIKQTFTFTPNSGTAILSFLATGTPDGKPPFSVLDGVSLQQDAVPEPATWGLMIAGFALVGLALRRRNQYSVAA